MQSYKTKQKSLYLLTSAIMWKGRDIMHYSRAKTLP